MEAEENIRYGCWLLDNGEFSGDDFTKEINFNGRTIELLITNYENSKSLGEPFNDWIHNKIVRDGMISGPPLPIDSTYVITSNGYSNKQGSDFASLLYFCLKLVYFYPTLVSHPSVYVPKVALQMPQWEGFQSIRALPNKEINSDTFEQVIKYFNRLNNLNLRYHCTLNEVYKISGINDNLIELLSLYSFIEGFLHNQKGKSNITNSLNVMLKDYEPQKKAQRKLIKSKIKAQNKLFGESKLDRMRHIVAHGIYKYEEDSWSKEQWEALTDQRNLLIETVIEALMNKITEENEVN